MIRPIKLLAALSLFCVVPTMSLAWGTYGKHASNCYDKSRDHQGGRYCKPVYTGKHLSNCTDKTKNHRDGRDCKTPSCYRHTSNCYDKTKDHHGGRDCRPKNRPPCALDDCTISVDANKSVVINVLGNDYDADGDKLTITKVSKPSHGTAVIKDNKVTYTPSKNYSGSDWFIYTITDGKGGCASAKVCIKVKSTPPPPPPTKTPPTAQDDCTIEVVKDTPIIIDVLDNDLPAGSTFTITDFTQPKNGKVVRNSDDTFTYTPNAGYVGTDSFTYTIANGAMCDGGPTAPYTLTSTVLGNGDVQVVLRQSRNVVDNTYGVNSSPGYPRQGEHWFKDLVNSDHARFVLKNGAGQTVMDFYVDYLSASNNYPSGYGTLGVTGGDGSISVGSASNIASVTTTMTTNLNQSPAFYGYTVDSPAPEANFPIWDYVDGYTVVIKKAAFGASGFGSVSSPDVHNSPAKKADCKPTPTICTSTAKVCLNVKGTPPPPPPACAGVLLFGPDAFLTDYLEDYLEANNFPGDVYVYKTTGTYVPGEFTTAINQYKTLNGAMPCATLIDTEYVGPHGTWSGLDAGDSQTLKDLILSGMGFVYAEPTDYGASPMGQFPSVLPVVPYTQSDHYLVYDIVDTTSPIVDTLPGLFLNPYGTGKQSFWPQSSGQDEGIAVDVLNPVAGVQYANFTTVLQSSTADWNTYLPGVGTGTGYTLDYQPASGPTSAQPGGRVVILGTDPYVDQNNNLSPTIQKLYFNSLKYAAGY